MSCLHLSRSLGTSAMKLGKKNKDIDSFVKKIESEGQSECVVSLHVKETYFNIFIFISFIVGVTNITAPRQSGMVAKTTGPATPQAP